MKAISSPKIMAMVGITLFCGLSQATKVTQVNRYATVENKPLASQINPLLTVQQIHFPQHVITVGDALTYWIQYSGFRLADTSQQSIPLKTIMAQPLPQVDRNFGPLTIQDGLTVLVGRDVFSLVYNPLLRTVNFKLKPKYTPTKGHAA